MSQPFHIAIIGGGIAGLCLAQGLLNYPHISFDIYEKSDVFQERRTGLQFTGTARQALRMISPDIGRLPAEIGGIETTMWTVVMGEGTFKGQKVYTNEYKPSERRIGFNRAAFLPGLLKHIPLERLHTGKRLHRIEVDDEAKEAGKHITAHFEDGTSAQADVVIGADGLRSISRHHVLEGLLPHDDILARPLNLWDARLMIPIEIAREHLGDLVPDPGHSRATMIAGNNGVFYFTLNEGGKYAACVIAGRRPQSTSSPWRFMLTQELLDEAFSDDWGELGRVVKQIYLDQPKPEAFFEWDVNIFPTFCRGRVCIIGDAAHAAAPWLAAGASIGMEDTAIMGKLLGKVRSVSEIDTAFKVFTDMRIGRAQTLLEHSRRSAFNVVEGARLTPEELRKADARLQDFLSIDFEAHVASILDAFEKEVASERISSAAEIDSRL